MKKAKQAIDNPESDLQQWLENALDEIERLQSENAKLGDLMLEKNHGIFQRQDARIRELVRFLVDERANLIEAGGEITRPRLCPEDQKNLDDLARDQLLAEGKIGGDDAT